jgi:hypothetical protein
MPLARDATAARGGQPIARVGASRLHGGRVRRALLAAAVAACGVVPGAGCGDASDSSAPGSSALGSPELQTSARQTDCMDWNNASAEERQVMIDSIAEFESGEPTGTEGRFLATEQAYDLFERACEPEYAGAFKLYKIYARAAAFQPEQQ